ncbi:MAG: undecaprenyldiphospho-muramoylpentapeptide beta-N-acetylglucosaminyltransferase [Clostridia bacterium]|nr:undecaprenyldiphospho-muramoylpentapeptide beta-N-acetylglucosaminyltransferase [Clostridia bacterium]
MRVIIAAAGTGGHINPGIAIANKIKEEERSSEIIFIGTSRGLENDLVPRAGYDLKTIEAYGLSKKITINNLKKMSATLKATGKARKIIQEFKPDIVIGAGGYICGPVVWAAKKENIPIILHESNAFPGKAVKVLSKKADTVLISFEEARERIPKAANIVFTGTPVKIEKKDYTIIQKENILKDINLRSDKPIVLIFGGSQGAQRINEAIIGIIENSENQDYQIIWATGPKQFDIIKSELNQKGKNINNIKNAKILPYIYNMEEIMNISDIIVARSGAMTITEISTLGKPSILIPLPNVSQNHQLYNAKVLENIGAAKIILNDELTKDKLNKEIQEIIKRPEEMKKMGEKALTKSVKDVQDRIYKEIKKIVKK